MRHATCPNASVKVALLKHTLKQNKILTIKLNIHIQLNKKKKKNLVFLFIVDGEEFGWEDGGDRRLIGGSGGEERGWNGLGGG